VVTAIIGACGEFLVSPLENVMKSLGVTETFVGMIFLPAVSKASECVTAATVAMKNIQPVINTIAARSVQTTLFITPFLVVLGWIIDQPMTLSFEVYETAILFFSGFLLSRLTRVGESMMDYWLFIYLLLFIHNNNFVDRVVNLIG